MVETRNTWDTYRVLPINATGTGRRKAAAECFTPERVEQLTTGDYAAVQGRHITLPGDIRVPDPVPGQVIEFSGELAGVLTLTTCHPQFSYAERMIVHGMLVVIFLPLMEVVFPWVSTLMPYSAVTV